mmetsp:Transcript_8539/g.13467  ORF Transcript_8539/g.13467 Transcript_8539/m.13467 type:complete len:208 (+) Transcript_8539:17-640(+)
MCVCQISEFAGPKQVAEQFGVSVKVVRNIWKRQSWVDATRHLWEKKEARPKRSSTATGDSSSDPVPPAGSTAPSAHEPLAADKDMSTAKRRASVSEPAAERAPKRQCSVDKSDSEDCSSDTTGVAKAGKEIRNTASMIKLAAGQDAVDMGSELSAGSDVPRSEGKVKRGSQPQGFRDPFAMDWIHALEVIARLETDERIELPSMQVM